MVFHSNRHWYNTTMYMVIILLITMFYHRYTNAISTVITLQYALVSRYIKHCDTTENTLL